MPVEISKDKARGNIKDSRVTPNKSGCSDRLLRKMMVCSCGVGFSVGAQLATLRKPAQRNGLQNFDRKIILKNT
jgi:hypothetical protein